MVESKNSSPCHKSRGRALASRRRERDPRPAPCNILAASLEHGPRAAAGTVSRQRPTLLRPHGACDDLCEHAQVFLASRDRLLYSRRGAANTPPQQPRHDCSVGFFFFFLIRFGLLVRGFVSLAGPRPFFLLLPGWGAAARARAPEAVTVKPAQPSSSS